MLIFVSRLRRWSPKYVSELYLYGESNGIIWDIVVNKTSQPINKLFVVGAFDTVSETSQIQFCSVGEWDGLSFDKVSHCLLCSISICSAAHCADEQLYLKMML